MNGLKREYRRFLLFPRDTRILIVANIVYAFVLPVIEIFVAAYVMRNSRDVSKVVTYQLAIYTGDPIAFLLNGFLLGRIGVQRLYALGMLMSSMAMLVMMSFSVLTYPGIAASGLLMGIASGLFWANRGFLALSTTNNENRNYFYGIETFFLTIISVTAPLFIGWWIEASSHTAWTAFNRNNGYRVIAVCALGLTIVSAVVINLGKYENPPKTRFLYLRFHPLWWRMSLLAALKGLAQGYLVTAPAMLIMMLVGQEGTLGTIQTVGGVLSAFVLYGVGRIARPEHRLRIFAVGLILFAAGSVVNGLLFDAVGVLIFMSCLVIAKPVLDLAYFPIQLLVTDRVAAIEGRNQYAYIFHHELGLFTGRFAGCVLFIVLALAVSQVAALKYALPVIAILQLFSIWVARRTLIAAGSGSELSQFARANETLAHTK